MLTQAQQVIALCEQFARWMHIYEESREIADERLYQYRLGLERMLAVVITRLSPIRADREPTQVQKQVVSLLNWLVGQKVCWMSGQRRRRSSRDEQKIWQIEGAIAQIDAMILALCSVLSPSWKSSPARHGKVFQVFHSRDFVMSHTSADIACQRWCGPQREQWYQEVAFVCLKHAENQLEEIFQLTNHIDQPWTRNREIAWSLDMHALASRFMQQGIQEILPPTAPSYPRSTSVGDIVVSLLSGNAWAVAPFGFQSVTLAERAATAFPLLFPLQEPLDVTFLIDHDQDALYEVRDHCRKMLLAGNEAVEALAQWIQEHYTEEFAQKGYVGISQQDWLDLAESCLADTQEVMGYEEANGLPVKP